MKKAMQVYLDYWSSHIWLSICSSLTSRCQLKCEHLEGQRKDLSTQCSVLESEKKDIVEYLKCALLEKEEEVEELTEHLESQRQAAHKDRDAQQLLHKHLMQELQYRVNAFATENETLGKP